MSTRRLIVLLLLVALAGAPSAVSAATGVAAGVAGHIEGPAGQAIDDGVLVTVLLVGLAGATVAALVGTGVFLAGRRRGAPDDGRGANGTAETTATMERRRALRRARVHLDDDPIVAAMGIGSDGGTRRPRERAGQASRGPDERAPGPPRR